MLDQKMISEPFFSRKKPSIIVNVCNPFDHKYHPIHHIYSIKIPSPQIPFLKRSFSSSNFSNTQKNIQNIFKKALEKKYLTKSSFHFIETFC